MNLKRVAINPARRAFVKLAYPGRVPLNWCLGSNWGDALNPVLVELLSGKRTFHVDGLHHVRYFAIGSILGGANELAEVWGSGFIFHDEKVIGKPRAVHSVRGPLSRASLLKQGIDCPEVYGDPALLLPSFFNPDVSKKFAVGIIPHYIDKDCPWLEQYVHDPQVAIIDIESETREFVRSVKSCDVIVSSSLHGLICADAYGVPNAWIQLSKNVVGGDFKFRDYRLSIGEDDPVPLKVSLDTKISNAVSAVKVKKIHIDLRKLILACPFLSDDLRCEVTSKGTLSGDLPKKFVSATFL